MVETEDIVWIIVIVAVGFMFVDESLNTPCIAEIDLSGTNGKTLYIIDGVTGTPNPYQAIAKHFNDLGYSVKVPILKDHCGKLSDVKDITMEEIEVDLKKDIQEQPGEVFLMGTCSGSLMAYDLSNELNKDVIIINMPLASTPGIFKYAKFIPYMYRVDFGLLKGDSGLSMVPRYHKYPTNALIDVNQFAKNLNRTNHNQLLIFQSKGDFRAYGVEEIYNMNKANSELIYLNNSGHLVYLDNEKQLVYDEIEEFMK